MIISGDNTSGGYRTLLNYINVLINNNIHVDLYFGHSTDSMKTYKGLSTVRENINDIINVIRSYNAITDYSKINYYLGLNVHKDYDILVANAWQIAESVYLNKQFVKKLIYIIQDEEYLFYPNDTNLQNKVKETYKSEYIYYCLSKYLSSSFKQKLPNSSITNSVLGTNLSKYFNKHINREKSIVIAYYQGKVGRLPKLVENIIELLSKYYKIYVFPDNYILQKSENIISTGKQTILQLNDIYNIATIGIVFSNTNPSRLGYEMLASGLRVIEYESKFTKYDMPDEYFTKISNVDNIINIVNNLMNSEYIYPIDFINQISAEIEHNILLELFLNNLSL
jgi:hypothetical protein